jgi:hypothetical protein
MGTWHMRRAQSGPPAWVAPALFLGLIGLAACQQPGQPGPMERAGANIDRTVVDVQRNVGDFSRRAGQSVEKAGQSVGNTAQRVGTGVHDTLVPADPTPAPVATPAWDDNAKVGP